MTGTQHRDERKPIEPDVLAVLRPLARRALGMSGADIERLVREARQVARRQRRSLSWQDIEERLVSGRAILPPGMRWRIAVHEAGHAVARLALGYDGIEMITIDDPSGGFVQMQELGHVIQLEGGIVARIVVLLAGRRSEIAFFGSAFAAPEDMSRAISELRPHLPCRSRRHLAMAAISRCSSCQRPSHGRGWRMTEHLRAASTPGSRRRTVWPPRSSRPTATPSPGWRRS